MALKLERARVIQVDPEKRTFVLKTLHTLKEVKAPLPVTTYRSKDGLTGFLYIPQVGDIALVIYDDKSGEVYVLGFVAAENLFEDFPFPMEPGDIIFVGGLRNYILMNRHGLIRLIGNPMCKFDMIPEMAKETIRALATQFDFQTPYWMERIVTDDFGYNYRFNFSDSSTAIPVGYFFVYEVYDSVLQPRLSIKIDRLGKVEYQSGLVKMTIFNNIVTVEGIIQLDVKAQKINLGTAPSFAFVLGEVLKQYLDNLKTWLDAHTHPTGVGPSGPPSTPSSPVPDILSKVITGQ